MGYVVGSAEVELVPTAKGFDEKTNVLLADLKVKVKLDADTLGVREQLASIRDAHVNVKADADTLLAEAQIDEVARPREATIDVSAPGAASAGSALGGVLTTVLALGPALIPLAGGLTAITLGLTAMAGAATLGGVALGAGIVAAISLDKAFTQKLMPSVNGLKKVFDSFVKTNFTALMDPLVVAIHLVSTLLPALSPIVRAASQAIVGLMVPLQALVDNGTFSRWASQIATLVGPAITGFGKMLGNLTLGIGQMLAAYAPFGKVVLADLVSLTGTFAKIGQSPEFKAFVTWSIQQVPLVTDVIHNLLGVAGGLLKVLAPWGQFVLSFIDALLGGSKGMKFFNDSLINLQNSMPQFVSFVSGLLTNLAVAIGKAAPVLATGLSAIIGGLVDAVAASMPKLLPALVIGLGKLTAALLAAIPALLPPVVRLLDGLLKGLFAPAAKDLLPSLLKTITDSIGKNAPAILAALAQLGPIFAQAGVNLWTNGWQKILGDLGNNIGHWFSTDLPNFVGDALKNIGQWLLQAGTNLLTGLVQGIVIGVVFVRDLLFTWPSQFGAWLARVLPTFLNAGAKALQSLGAGVVQGWQDVQAWFVGLPGRIGSFFANAPAWLRTHGVQILVGLVNGIVTGYKNVTSWFHDLPGRIEAFGVGAINWLADVGHNIVQGLLNGLSGAWGAVTNFVQHAINAIPVGIRKLLGINSPSTVMAEIGGYMGQGLQLGLVSSLHDAMNAATTAISSRTNDLAVSATASVQTQMNGTSLNVMGDPGLQRIIAILLQLLDKTAGAREIASAMRVQARTGGVVTA